MSEKAPQGLKRPSVAITTLSRKPIVIIVLLLLIIIGLVVSAIFTKPDFSSEEPKELVIRPSEDLDTIANGAGLNLPKAPETKGVTENKAPKDSGRTPLPRPITVVRPQIDPLSQMRQQELLETRRYKRDLQRAALQSEPLAYKSVADQGKGSNSYSEAAAGNKTTYSQSTVQQPANTTSTRQKHLQNDLDYARAMAAAAARGEDPSTVPYPAAQGEQTIGAVSDDWDNGFSMQGTNPLALRTGAIIPTVLITGINSDLSGQIIGQVSQDVYDTATGDNMLIPQGTRLVGQYKNGVALGAKRLFVAWTRLVFPDGRTMTLNKFPGADQLGQSGLSDKVNNHYFRIYGHALLMSLITGGTAYSIDTLSDSDSDVPSFSQSMGMALATQMSQASLTLLQKFANISPTLTVRPGYKLNVVVVKDLQFTEQYENKL
ncbi:TrbI/VirB10 family protein [Desulforhopalus singaporensis]|uniref:Type IV secretion system protein VirB10 n=1 Tax=Desulforhopalus singaporensis TaxID=91360 RepID=A0A1H0S3R9_9BACT|nr:TrbI/VirB10 family protein [Desulforhopalus singaporensis]SDP35886.1 type IV secretion system protein VirB10 [Desulforhopalus singaporensis]